ncbi:MAG TPA: hypothetical protein PLM41_07945, partial [Saprospiraceae bacterium]|nr:hypothetical protein [Saprospiraceae bacterium]
VAIIPTGGVTKMAARPSKIRVNPQKSASSALPLFLRAASPKWPQGHQNPRKSVNLRSRLIVSCEKKHPTYFCTWLCVFGAPAVIFHLFPPHSIPNISIRQLL